MTNTKWIVGMVLFTLIVMFGGIWFVSGTASPQITTSQNAKADVADPTSYDWGNILMNNGNVTKTFTIKNTGTDTLKLFNVKTSCHCTVANITINGVASQYFGMSGVSSWIGEVSPKEEAKLTAVFDPAFHGPQGVGPITRFVSIETNDPGNAKLTFTLTGTVIK